MSDEREDAVRRAANLEDRTVSGGSPIGGGSTMASSGAFDTSGGGDLGGPGARDPGDSAGDLRPEAADVDTEGLRHDPDLDRAAAERLADQVFSGPEADQGGVADPNKDKL